MYSFQNDYSELAHEDILTLINKVKNEQNIGYGHDKHSQKAKDLIQSHLKNNCDIHFLTGGTSTNKIIISHFLHPYEGIISVETGHINVNEAGAIEASGHKIITVKGSEGKITPDEIIKAFHENQSEHMVVPKLVYISNSTELGTIYLKDELEALSKICKELNLYLFIDGARLGVALTSEKNDLTLYDISNLCDAFYIGGTKNGALLGEAAIICNPHLKPYFKNSIKLNGGLLAKGFLVGLQFEALFTNELFFRLAKHANKAARMLVEGLNKLNVKLAYPSPTNQQFIYLDKEVVEKIKNDFLFEIWEEKDNGVIIRLVTSWATDINQVAKFLDTLKKYL